MAKREFIPPTPIDQGIIPNINDPKFDTEDEFFRRSCKIRAIAELIHHLDTVNSPIFSDEANIGIREILETTTKELRDIFYKAWQEEA